jgi:hypothetical protein
LTSYYSLKTYVGYAAGAPSGVSAKAKGGLEPTWTDAAVCTSVRYQEKNQKPSTTTSVLNGVFGRISLGGISMCQRRSVFGRMFLAIIA